MAKPCLTNSVHVGTGREQERSRAGHDFHLIRENQDMDQGRIYIAEQDKDFQQHLRRALTQYGFAVTVFDSGYPIVAMMDNWPDIFLIDIELPDINGIEVCKWLKSHASSSNIPVILLSGDPYLKVIAGVSHADDYIEKPVALRHLIGKIMAYFPAEKIH